MSAVAVPEIVRLVRAHQPIRLSTAARWRLAAGVFSAAPHVPRHRRRPVDRRGRPAGLYPAITVALAAIVLHERIGASRRPASSPPPPPSSLSSRPLGADRIASEHSGGTLAAVVRAGGLKKAIAPMVVSIPQEGGRRSPPASESRRGGELRTRKNIWCRRLICAAPEPSHAAESAPPDNHPGRRKSQNPTAGLRGRWKIVSTLVINDDPKLALIGDV